MRILRLALALCLGPLALAAPAAAVEFPYQFDAAHSLTGNCETVFPDPIPDPSTPPCPGGAHPPSGRFNDARTIAIDAYGDEYVASYAATAGEVSNGRIDVFDDEGLFIAELADPKGPRSIAVDSKGVLYVYEASASSNSEVVRYVPSEYKPAEGKIAYGNPRVLVTLNELTTNGLAVDSSNDHLFIASGAQILEYSSAEAGNTLLHTITNPKLNSSNWVAVDGQRRRIYASYCKNSIIECGVLVLEADPPYGLLKEIDGSTVPSGSFQSAKGWLSIAVNEANGHFFVDDLEVTKNVYEFDENFAYAAKVNFSSFKGGRAQQIAVANSPLNPGAANREYLFVPRPELEQANAFAFEPPSVVPPSVETLSTPNVSETEAELAAEVNPGGALTEYAIEYVSEAQFQTSEFAGASVAGEGTLPGGKLPLEVSAVATGLDPGGAYRFRVVAKNEAGEAEAEASFSTYDDAPAGGVPCPNDALRSGPSAHLPDCRAYELVTPPDTNGRPPTGVTFNGDRFPTLEASPQGDALSFMLEGGSLPGTEGAGGFHGDLYRVTRGFSGWSTAGAGPSGTEASIPIIGSTSSDQGYSFWIAEGEGTAVVEEGKQAHYVRYPDGHSELIGRGSLGVDPRASGKLITEGGGHIVFQTSLFGGAIPQQLEEDAPPTGTTAVYDRTPDEVTHVVSLLPGDVTPAADAAYLGASADGEAIAFRVPGSSSDPTAGKLYLRVGNETTYEIADSGVPFAGVSEGGERIFYLEGGDLLAYDTGAEEVVEFSETGDVTPVNVSTDGTSAYFVSPSVLGGPNPEGDVAEPGKQNLYRSAEGALSFVATVTDRDVEGEVNAISARVDGLGLWSEAVTIEQPARVPARLDSDGSVLLFQSRANLTGYPAGESAQIYRYDATADRLHCISCIPTGAPAAGGARLESYAEVGSTEFPFSLDGFVPNLTPDGRRAFFDSTEALVSTDTDGALDVYEWEEEGEGSCKRPGGCVYLISSGHSAYDNYLYAMSEDGRDVFFKSTDVLVAGDNDTYSIYDARVNGGFASGGSAPCEGEGCRPGLAPPPSLARPESGTGGESGNLEPSSAQRKGCPKGKRKVKRRGKPRCVKVAKKRKHRTRRSTGHATGGQAR
jgi:hypothetical protein